LVDAGLAREIALVLDHIEEEREFHQEQLTSLLGSECYVWTELHGIDRRTLRYSPHIFPEREKFLSRLQRIGHERRQLTRKNHERIEELHSKLLSLLNKHAHLKPENGD